MNYRCFKSLDVSLGKFQVVVGANGSGKSTFLDIPVLLGDMLGEHHIGAAFLNHRRRTGPRASSLKDIVHRGTGSSFRIGIEARLPERVMHATLKGATMAVRENEELWPKFVRYELRLIIRCGQHLLVDNEFLFTFSGGDQPRGFLKNALEARNTRRFSIFRVRDSKSAFRPEGTAGARERLTQVPFSILALPKIRFEDPEEYPVSNWLLDMLTQESVSFDPEFEKLRMACPPGQPPALAADGQNLPWVALRLQEEHPDNFLAWKRHVCIAVPQVKDIEVVRREDDGHAYFRATNQNDHAQPSSVLSEGTLRIMALLLSSYLPQPPGHFIVEEPEHGIYPQAIEAVLDGLTTMQRSQVLVSSHSPVVVANTKIEQLIAAKVGGDGSAALMTGSKHPGIEKWKESVNLGTLFASGILG